MSFLIEDAERGMRSRRTWLSGEPSLQEMLSDEVMQAMMRRDGVRRDDLLTLIRRLQQAWQHDDRRLEIVRQTA